MISFYQPRARDWGAIGYGAADGGTVELPTVACQRRLQSATQFSVSYLVDDLLKLCLRESQTLFEEAFANLKWIIDHD